MTDDSKQVLFGVSGPGPTGDRDEDRQSAINAMIQIVNAIGEAFKVCPYCLTFTVAAFFDEALSEGKISHQDQPGPHRYTTLQ